MRAQPLVETYAKQQELRLKVLEICRSQFHKAQYLPVQTQEEDLRYMISERGVQSIKPYVVPSQASGSYKCHREQYEQPMLLGRTYLSPAFDQIIARPRPLSSSTLKLRLELEPCDAGTCLIQYRQLDNGLVDRSVVAFRRLPVVQ